MRETAFEQAARTVPAQYTIQEIAHRGGKIFRAYDAVGAEVLNFHAYPSDSRDTFYVAGSYLKEWDEELIQAGVLYTFYYRATSAPKKSLAAALRKELRTSSLTLPPAVADVVDRVRAAYKSVNGEAGARAWEVARKAMRALSKAGATEDDVVREWRALMVREVQES